VKVHVAVLPKASVAVHTTVVLPPGNRLPEGGTHSTVGLSSQSSVAVGGSKVTTVPPPPVHSRPVMSSGQSPMTGGVVSWTITSKVQVPVLPSASVPTHVTVVTPTGNALPEGGEHATVGLGSQLSIAVAVPYSTTTLPGPTQSTVTSSGQVTAGPVSSTTMTVMMHSSVPPTPLSAVIVTMSPSDTRVPSGGSCVRIATGGGWAKSMRLQ
jgi:hypothetical protein